MAAARKRGAEGLGFRVEGVGFRFKVSSGFLGSYRFRVSAKP